MTLAVEQILDTAKVIGLHFSHYTKKYKISYKSCKEMSLLY